MTFEQWWSKYEKYCDIMTQEEMARDAWDEAMWHANLEIADLRTRIISLQHYLDASHENNKVMRKLIEDKNKNGDKRVYNQ